MPVLMSCPKCIGAVPLNTEINDCLNQPNRTFSMIDSFPMIDLQLKMTQGKFVSHSNNKYMDIFTIILQVIVGLGILNVWLLRAGKATPFRGGEAKSMREEFAAYGLPFWFMCVVGGLKVGLALALLAAIWIPQLAQPAAIGMGLLMLGALLMHLKVKDPVKKSLPALGVLAMCAAIALL